MECDLSDWRPVNERVKQNCGLPGLFTVFMNIKCWKEGINNKFNKVPCSLQTLKQLGHNRLAINNLQKESPEFDK
jgi:hypothetical protein